MPCVFLPVQASLLCSLAKELRGHLIAEDTCTDALLQDAGTQTYKFLSAPFKRDMSLADITADRPPELHVQLGAEGVTSRHNKASSAFTFLCGQTFLRREFPAHFRCVPQTFSWVTNVTIYCCRTGVNSYLTFVELALLPWLP